MPSFAQLEYLLSVDTHRHFGRAAKACHVTQPTLSAGLAKLEAELGVVLFDRSMQPIVPTSDALAVIEQARLVIAEFAKISVLASNASKEIAGKLLIGVIPTLSSYLIPLFLEEFASAYPKLHIEIREMTTGEITEALSRESIDVGVLALPVDVPTLQSIALFNEPFYLYVHDHHVYAKRKSIDPTELDGREMWLLEEGHCFRNQVLKACKLRGKRPALANVRFESGSLETLKRLVARGLGYTLVPHLAIAESGESDESAKIIKFTKPMPAREIGLIFRRLQLKRPAIAALATSIKKNLPRSLIVAGQDVDVLGIT